ncbi:hypothetical protein PAL_GLEAN10009368 [Pteropus alecto]|uniref:Uncharacterized protein n=1 Tax=Pteropus alecto TaxID=9402 RepID=L5KUU3_PTEAL|nr:hypothetical protein PAL_GLEAN10009368 [Pteropus alecto]
MTDTQRPHVRAHAAAARRGGLGSELSRRRRVPNAAAQTHARRPVLSADGESRTLGQRPRPRVRFPAETRQRGEHAAAFEPGRGVCACGCFAEDDVSSLPTEVHPDPRRLGVRGSEQRGGG